MAKSTQTTVVAEAIISGPDDPRVPMRVRILPEEVRDLWIKDWNQSYRGCIKDRGSSSAVSCAAHANFQADNAMPSETRRVFESQKISNAGTIGSLIVESLDSGSGQGLATILRSGPNKSGTRLYPPETLRRDHSVFSQVPIFLDHPTAHERATRPERKFNDKVGVVGECFFNAEKNAIQAPITIHDPETRGKILGMKETGQLQEAALSVRARVTEHEEPHEGDYILVVDRLEQGLSVDLVTKANAGGEVLAMESAPEPEDGTVSDSFFTGTAMELMQQRPDLVHALIGESEREESEDMDEKKTKEMIEEATKPLNEKLEVVQKERDKANKKLAVAEAEKGVEGAIREAKLPERAALLIRSQFAGKESDEGVAEAITSIQEVLVEAEKAAKSKTNGKGAPSKAPLAEGVAESDKSGGGEAEGGGEVSNADRLTASFERQFVAEGYDPEKAKGMARTAGAGRR